MSDVEAAVVTDTGSTDGAGDGDGGAAATATAAPEFDYGPLEDRMDEMQTSLSSMIEQRLPAQTQRQEPQQDTGIPGQFFDPTQFGFDDDGGDDYLELDAQQFQTHMQQQVDQQVAAKVEPLQQMVTQLLHGQIATKIEQQYPELQDKKKAAEVLKLATDQAQALGLSQEDAQHPLFLKMVYEAQRGVELAAQIQTAGGGGSDGTEAPGGAQPATASTADQEQAAQNAIVQRGRKSIWDT